MSLHVISNVGSIADEGASLKVSYLLRKSIFDNEPDVVAGNCCALILICKAGNVDGGRGVNMLGVQQ
jgi:hypothetical protein